MSHRHRARVLRQHRARTNDTVADHYDGTEPGSYEHTGRAYVLARRLVASALG